MSRTKAGVIFVILSAKDRVMVCEPGHQLSVCPSVRTVAWARSMGFGMWGGAVVGMEKSGLGFGMLVLVVV